ncbi:MAG: phytoene/squalene synthase family protein [Bryobacterales bacterium]|nr:phytoene/squalene synthase family protein [Bryobacterales bacterium]MBV9397252.1 phytoene/squalene synthase family protein [Bryobacterales bacterium]
MSLAESYAFCERIARTQAKNFYYSFLLLPAAQRRAMCAIYAFMRYCDDLSDDDRVSDRAAGIERWKRELEAALSGRGSAHVLWPAFIDTVQRYHIPHKYFFEMIEGVSSDLQPRQIRNFAELYDYCYHVASVVGLTVIHIFGFDSPEALQLAEKCGVAFQLTNIIRDVKEDAEKDRIYLPQEDVARFGVKVEGLRAATVSSELRDLLAFEAQRARKFYSDSAPLIGMVDRRSRASLHALIGIYSRLLNRIIDSNYEVLAQRVRVPAWEKCWILARSVMFNR